MIWKRYIVCGSALWIPCGRGLHIWKDASGRNRNNLPKASESRVAHVRPHGRDSTDTAPLPTGGSMTKQCFWLNNSYVAEQIKEV